MCNRYRLKSKPDELVDLFTLAAVRTPPELDGEFFPGKPVPVIRLHEDGRYLEQMTWGFPPFKGKRVINNTRSEKAGTSRYWRRHLDRRCVFPLSEAVEWKHMVDTSTGELLKVPHGIRFRDDRVAAVAGIYMTDDEGNRCSMMTCRANEYWATIHNAKPDDPRMVCFLLNDQDIEQWLDPANSYDDVHGLLKPIASDSLIAEPLLPFEDKSVDQPYLFG